MAPLVTAAIGIFTSFMQGRQKVSQAKAEAKVQRLTNGIPGYTDEMAYILWGAPFALCFIPGAQEYAVKGFEYMDKLPSWYVGTFVTITLAAFGLDKAISWKQLNK